MNQMKSQDEKNRDKLFEYITQNFKKGLVSYNVPLFEN